MMLESPDDQESLKFFGDSSATIHSAAFSRVDSSPPPAAPPSLQDLPPSAAPPSYNPAIGRARVRMFAAQMPAVGRTGRTVCDSKHDQQERPQQDVDADDQSGKRKKR
ncbi:hypothetical protein [Limnoglobus roseus]|uniref:hypothetical protein n=1 Tax=Limnoglobus roseus TaxID=2598579 RepID=UPI0011EB64A8|nr:hypothetical protein [Limnoglobus roseus]